MEIPKPHDLEIEKAVLGAMLLEYPALELVISFLRTEHFYDIKHQIIYEALLELYNNGQEERDILVMAQKLKTDGTLKKAGGPAYIAEVTQNISSASNIEEHARILQQMYFMRELVKNSVETIGNVKANIDFFELLESREKFDFSIQSQLHTTEVHSISEVSKDIGRKLAIPANNTDGITGLPTGFLKSIDIPMAGLQSELIYLAGRPGQGKGLTLSTNIVTDIGYKKIKDIKIGDKVAGLDGNFYNVTGVYPQGIKDVYTVHFDDGITIDCDDTHLWHTRTRKNRKNLTNKEGCAKSTLEILNTLHANTADKRMNHSVPFCKPVLFQKKQLNINPYLLGIIIGDGCTSSGVMISNPEQYIRDKVMSILPDSDTISFRGKGKNYNDFFIIRKHRKARHLCSTMKALVDYGLRKKRSYEKFIPKDYLLSSVEDRIELLRGLIDTDGTLSKQGNITYCTTSEQLKDDICFLVRSLGGRCSANKYESFYKKNGQRIKCRDSYNISIIFTNGIQAFSSPKHLKRANPKRRNLEKYITDIKYKGKEETICISVDSPDRLFLTDNFIVTHNTQVMLNMARNMSIDFKIPVAIFSIEMSKESLVTRIQSAHTRIQRDKFKRRNFTEQDWVLYNSRIQDVITAPIYIDDTPSINILELRSKARKLVKKKGVKAIFIDYVQLITTTVGLKDKVGNREQELSYISKQLLAMRKELGVPVIALSQLSRAVESRQDKRPILSDLRESGGLEQDADIVLFLYRPWYYKQEATDPHTNEPLGRHYTELIYGKFREGGIDSYGLSFIGEFSYMEDYRHEIPDWAKYNPNPITIPDSYERNEIFRTLPPERSKEDMPF